MKILFVVPYAPSLIRVRPYNLIRSLAARGHQVTVATLWTSAHERQELDALETHGVDVCARPLPAWHSIANCLRALPDGAPLQAHYSWSPALLSDVMRLCPTADVVHVEHLRGARYGLAVAAQGTPGTPVIWDSVDCISDLFQQAAGARTGLAGRLLMQIELPRTRRFEGTVTGAFDRVLVTSATDRAALLALAREARGDTPIDVLTNGVDLQYFTPGHEPRDPDTLVFSGKMSYHANERAVQHLVQTIMPIVWTQRPATRLVVVGKDPSARLRRLLAGAPSRVTVTGTVADIRPSLRRAAIAVVPLVYGAGCQNKVLEAMACATPVVATPRAVSALSVQRGRDVLVADEGPAFAQAVLDLLANQDRQRDMGDAGRRYVDTHHRWDLVAHRLETIYLDALAARRIRSVRSGDLLSA